MPIAARFYRSVYLTLGLACACLAYAEMAFLPEMVLFAAAVAVLLVVAYRVEGRWALSIRGANVLGVVIALGAAAYAVLQTFRPQDSSLIYNLPWPTSLLPYLGPLLIVLVPAKLFRPKHIGDYWGLHGIGLMAVALGCALAGDPFFVLLMLIYLVSFVWSLTLFYYYRQSRRPVARMDHPVEPRVVARSWTWATLGTIMALTLFLATPRLGESRWELSLSTSALQTGINDERPTIDLNHQGVVSVNRDLAFEVRAYLADGETPKTDLPPSQLWRSASFNYYENGRWENRADAEQRDRMFGRSAFAPDPADLRQRRAPDPRGAGPPIDAPTVPPAAVSRGNSYLPYLGESQYFLRFTPHGRGVQNAILAEPIWRSPAATPAAARQVSVVTIGRNRQFAWYEGTEGELAPPALGMITNPMVYRQVLAPPREPNLSDPIAVSDSYRQHLCSLRSLRELRRWTESLARQLAVRGTIPPEALGPGRDSGEPIRVPPIHAESVARAFEAHLATSGEFRYSLKLDREDGQVDPAEDFLLNTRKGHCNRFATALALMLRSIGIPSRIVLGYQGFETDDSGLYEVRQCHAHAWVEAIVQRRDGGKTTWHWLTLNPTPALGDGDSGGSILAQWFDSIRTGFNSFFRFLLVDADTDQPGRSRFLFDGATWSGVAANARNLALGESGNEYWRPIVAGGILVGAWLLWRRWRRATPAAPAPPAEPAALLHQRMRGLVRRFLGLEPLRSQTPAEFAAVAAQRLAARGRPAEEQQLPEETVVVYYRARYGHKELTDVERQGIAQRLDRLESDLGRP